MAIPDRIHIHGASTLDASMLALVSLGVGRVVLLWIPNVHIRMVEAPGHTDAGEAAQTGFSDLLQEVLSENATEAGSTRCGFDAVLWKAMSANDATPDLSAPFASSRRGHRARAVAAGVHCTPKRAQRTTFVLSRIWFPGVGCHEVAIVSLWNPPFVFTVHPVVFVSIFRACSPCLFFSAPPALPYPFIIFIPMGFPDTFARSPPPPTMFSATSYLPLPGAYRYCFFCRTQHGRTDDRSGTLSSGYTPPFLHTLCF